MNTGGYPPPTKEKIMQNEWTQGFDAGVACLLDEIEKYTEKREYEPRIHTPLMRLI